MNIEPLRMHACNWLRTAHAYVQTRSVPFWEECLLVVFALSIVLFPFGQMFRVLPPLFCAPVLILLYRKDWANRTLPKLPGRWLFALLFTVIALEVIMSHWFALSWQTVRPNVLRGFFLPFVALECVRNERDLRILTAAFVLAALITGLSGVWQFTAGTDFITGTAPLSVRGKDSPLVFIPGALESLRDFRLTGPLSTYRVGNYLALIGLPACGLFLLWPDKPFIRHPACRAVLTLCVLAPAIFLWLGAQSRSGYLAVLCGLYLAWLLFARPRWFLALLPLATGTLVALFGPERLSLSHALADERAAIWGTAWQCFLAHPWFGTGAETYAQACASLGITHLSTGSPIPPHPHSIYLQWLVDGGLAGFTAMAVFFIGLTIWSACTIRHGLLKEPDKKRFWQHTAFFWAGWCGYLFNGLSAHGFYRTWWISVSFSILGILLGACTRGSMPRAGQQRA